MVEQKPHRIIRDLTPGERSLLHTARADAENEIDSILEQACAAKAACNAVDEDSMNGID